MSDESVSIDVQIQLDILKNLLTQDQGFIDELRQALLKDARARGNSFGRWGTRRPVPKSVQENTTQRIF
jgi:hypothetical protein